MNLKTILVLCGISLFATNAYANGSKYKAYYIALETDFFDPPTRDVLTSTPYVVTFDSQELDTIVKSAKEKTDSAKNDMKALRVLIVDNQAKQDLYITQDKSLVVDGKDASADKSAVDAIIAQIEKKLGNRLKPAK